MKMSRRRVLGGVCFAGMGTAGYAHFFEAHRLETTLVDVPLGTAQPSLKLLHISDLHASAVVSLDYIASAIDAGLRLRPDLICITGDFVTARWEHCVDYASILSRLSNAAPCFASLGNHDGGKWSARHGGYHDPAWIRELLASSGIRLLLNESASLELKGRRLRLVGLGDLWSGQFDPAAAFARPPGRDQQTIALSHNPDSKEKLAGAQWDLMLCGHTHGGQLKLPIVGTPFAPVADKRFVSGLHPWNGRWIHVTRGVGSIYGIRINCPPEVNLLTLT